MKMILIYCVLLFALAGVAVAQVLPADKGLLPSHRVGGLASGVRTSVAEYDTMLTVRPTLYTHYDGMEKACDVCIPHPSNYSYLCKV